MDSPVVHAILTLSVVAAAGLSLGALRVRGVGLGTAGVMFAGLVLGHLGVRLDESVLDFAREFGLVLFVFTIGMQLGPGFLASFREQGVRLNLPGTGLAVNRPSIDPALQDKILDAQHPSDFALALKVDRTVAPVAGKAWLFVGNTEADSIAFNFTNLNASTQIFDIRAGMGTASGTNYRASVFVLRFQIWAPSS